MTENKEWKAEEIIKTITKRINDHSEEIKGWDKAFQIMFKDLMIAYWIKISTNGTVEKVEKSTEKKEAAATINSTTDTLQSILDGKISPILAMISGQIQIEGSIETLMKLRPAFS